MKNNEALRCLLCKKPKCSLQGCPVHTPIPECMALYREDRLDEAGKLEPGMKVMLMGFGVGLSWGATVVEI